MSQSRNNGYNTSDGSSPSGFYSQYTNQFGFNPSYTPTQYSFISPESAIMWSPVSAHSSTPTLSPENYLSAAALADLQNQVQAYVSQQQAIQAAALAQFSSLPLLSSPPPMLPAPALLNLPPRNIHFQRSDTQVNQRHKKPHSYSASSHAASSKPAANHMNSNVKKNVSVQEMQQKADLREKDLLEQIKKLTTENQLVKSNLAEMDSQYKETLKVKDDQLNKLTAENQLLKADLTQMDNEQNEMRKVQDEQSAEAAVLNQAAQKKLQDELEQVNAESEAATAQLKAVLQQVKQDAAEDASEKSRKIADQAAEISLLKSQIKQMEKSSVKKTELPKENTNKLQGQLQKQEKVIEKLKVRAERDTIESCTEISKLKSEIARLTDANLKHEKDSEAKNLMLAKLAKHNETIFSKNVELNAIIADQHEKIEELIAANQGLDEENEEQEEDYNNLEIMRDDYLHMLMLLLKNHAELYPEIEPLVAEYPGLQRNSLFAASSSSASQSMTKDATDLQNAKDYSAQ
ncbi:MAG: hypothetical protein P4M12_08315 [Gammaproteobacteria bacterium]|nr:hypothetical protein [Gammaproteobacteria bacterium]